MGSDVEFVKIGDHCTVVSGFAFKSKDLTDYGIPVVKIKNVNNKTVDLTETQFFPEELVMEKHNKFFLKNGDILIAMTGQGSVGRVGRFRSNGNSKVLLNQRVGKFSVASTLDLGFLYYVLSSERYEKILFDAAVGSGQPNLGPSNIYNIEIPYTDHSRQKAIAHILGSLDDKIELNRQMNTTLESMAQALFKSWFVDFDPVIDNALAAGNPIPEPLKQKAAQRAQQNQAQPSKASNAESASAKASKPHQSLFPSEFEFTEEMGWIPKGWEVVKLNELLTIKYGKDHKKLEEGAIPVYGSGGLMRFVNQSLYLGESILIPRKGTLSNLMFVDEEFWTVDTMFFSIPILKNSAKYLFPRLKMLDFASMNVGSAVPSMTTKVLNDLDILKPEEGALKEFDKLSSDFFTKKKSLDKENSSLTKLRDTLLPKLLSGELRIPRS